MTRILSVFNFLKRVGFALLLLTLPVGADGNPPAPSAPYFIENIGQWEGDFQFKCEVGSTVYYVTPKGLTIDFREFRVAAAPVAAAHPDPFERERDSVTVRGHVVQIHYAIPPRSSGGGRGGQASGQHKLAHYSNYFLGRDSCNWRSRVGHYQTIVVPEVWPGIDVEYRADKLGVETIYHVNPGADPAQIQMEYLGLDAPLRVDAQGNLVLRTTLGDVKEQAPYAFQQEGRIQKRVESGYRLLDGNRVELALDSYDRSKALSIDPLLYGTYLGSGAPDEGHRVCSGPDGGVYVAGGTYALSGFPTTPGAYDKTGLYYGHREFVSRFGPGGEFLASTLYGIVQTLETPSTNGGVWDMLYDSARGGLWIGGYARDDNWPLTPDAFDTEIDDIGDGFILRFSDSLTTLLFCSYLGGSSGDHISALELGADGTLYVAGSTLSTDFPLTPDAFITAPQAYDWFIWVYDPEAQNVVFSSYWGGSDHEQVLGDIILDDQGILWLMARTFSMDIPVTEDAFQSVSGDTSEDRGDIVLAGFSFTPPTVEYCSYLGGGSDDPLAFSIADSAIWVAGRTASLDFPVTANAFDTIGSDGIGENYYDGFIARLNWRTNDYVGTFFGGGGDDIFVQNAHWVHDSTITLLGLTTSDDLPVTPDAYQLWPRFTDGFVTKFSADLRELRYCSYLGGSGNDEPAAAYVVNADSLWATGATLSNSLPVTPNALQPTRVGLTDGYVHYFAIDTTAVSAADRRPLPSEFALEVFPNPFNARSTLSLTVGRPGTYTLTLHDVLGRLVFRQDIRVHVAGRQSVALDFGEYSSGLYFA